MELDFNTDINSLYYSQPYTINYRAEGIDKIIVNDEINRLIKFYKESYQDIDLFDEEVILNSKSLVSNLTTEVLTHIRRNLNTAIEPSSWGTISFNWVSHEGSELSVEIGNDSYSITFENKEILVDKEYSIIDLENQVQLIVEQFLDSSKFVWEKTK
ncbi:hypothetical protein [Croceimicrobium sp.]|uniref:hypothetical protein n=1 Tax=Croceimicrobium sp. TaxID=2828340 RepID=UPI003BA953A7